MIITHKVTALCDSFGKRRSAPVTAVKLRRDLEKRGWSFKKFNSINDYCPECTRKHTEEAKRVKP